MSSLRGPLLSLFESLFLPFSLRMICHNFLSYIFFSFPDSFCLLYYFAPFLLLFIFDLPHYTLALSSLFFLALLLFLYALQTLYRFPPLNPSCPFSPFVLFSTAAHSFPFCFCYFSCLCYSFNNYIFPNTSYLTSPFLLLFHPVAFLDLHFSFPSSLLSLPLPIDQIYVYCSTSTYHPATASTFVIHKKDHMTADWEPRLFPQSLSSSWFFPLCK